MLPAHELPAALVRLPLITLHGPWFRVVAFHLLQGPPPGSAPGERPRALWPQGAVRSGGRFTPQGSFGTVYLSEEPSTALAEVRGVLHDLSGGLRVLNPEPWTLVTVQGALFGALDLVPAETQAQLGTSLAELTADWRGRQSPGLPSPTQQLGLAAYESGLIVAIRCPSAVAEGHSLAVFADRLVPGGESFLQVVDPHGLLDQRLPPVG